MLCTKCQNEVENNSKFCPFCGEKLVEDVNKNKILFTLKPVFLVNLETVLVNLIGYLFVSFFFIPLFGIFTFIIGPILIHFALRGYYELSVYNFYPDRIEYINTFIYERTKTLSYKNIVNVELKKGILQQKYNLGTIFIMSGRLDVGGMMRIENIPNPDMHYAKIQQLIKEHE